MLGPRCGHGMYRNRPLSASNISHWVKIVLLLFEFSSYQIILTDENRITPDLQEIHFLCS